MKKEEEKMKKEEEKNKKKDIELIKQFLKNTII